MNSPFALTFHEALSTESFLSRIRQSGEEKLRAELAQDLSNAGKVSLALGKFVYERGKLLVELPNGAKAADLMVANGRRVAQLKQVAGKAGTRLQVIGGGAKVGANAVAVWLVVIEACHMVSAHDNAKRIKKIESHAKQIASFQETELVAELESCYRQAKEICLAPEAEQSEHDRALLSQLGQSLFRIRSQWRDRVRRKLSEIDPASAAWWTHMVRWKRKDSLNDAKRQRSSEAIESREVLHLMQFSLMLQFALSQRTGRATSFIDHTLADEVAQWRELAAFARARGGRIFSGRIPKEFNDFAFDIDSIASYWDVMVSRQTFHETTVKEYAESLSLPVATARKILNTQFETGHCERFKRGAQFVYAFAASTAKG